MTIDLQQATLRELFQWVGAESDPDLQDKKRFFLQVKTAMGNGTVEERLLRLMTWVGTKLISTQTHSRLTQPFEILKSGTAWCDQQTKIFGFFAWWLLGVPARELAMKHMDGVNGHSVLEAMHNDSWHLYDVHSEHQAVYRHPDDGHIMDWQELATHPDVVVAENHWWRGNNGMGKEGFYDPTRPPETCSELHLGNKFIALPW